MGHRLSRSIVTGFLVVLALVGVGLGPAAATSTTLCTGYDTCNLAGMPHAGYKEASGNRYWGMFAGHNCTNYVAYRMVQNGMANSRPWSGTGDAYNWGAANAGKTNGTPAVGAVAWWDAAAEPSSGHVAYVERVISADEIVISEDAWGGNFHWRRITRSGGGWPTGFIHLKDVGGYADGTALRASDNGEVYIVAGGAPIYLSSWATVGGVRATTDISRASLDAMRQFPADGTFVSAGGYVYRFVGGAPVYVSSWAAVGGSQASAAIDPAAIANAGGASPWHHVRQYPADGTVVSSSAGYVYRFAGGSPLYVSSWTAIGGSQASTLIDQAAIDNADAASPWNHVHRYPADGTFVTVTAGYVYRFAGGAPIYVSSWAAVGGAQPTTLVDGAALDNGDGASPWNHVHRYPANGTFVYVASGPVYRFLGGAPVYVSAWSAVGGSQPATLIDNAAIDNADKAVPYNHIHWYPADGSIVRSGVSGGYSVVTGGYPKVTATTAGAVVVDPAALANRGTGGGYNHLKADPAVPFADVPAGAPFYADIQWMSGQGITTGSLQPDGSVLFRPGDPVSREAVAAFLYRAAGSPAFTAPSVSPFVDVAVTAPFYKEITWLAARGISTGYPTAGGQVQFRPAESVSRQAMAAFLYRSRGNPMFTPPASSPFGDVATSHPFYKEIAWLAAMKISTGVDVGGGRFDFQPDAAVSRQAAAAFLHRASVL